MGHRSIVGRGSAYANIGVDRDCIFNASSANVESEVAVVLVRAGVFSRAFRSDFTRSQPAS